MIKGAVIKLIEDELRDALADASYTITDADASNPAILLRTVDRDPKRLATLHAQEIERITNLVRPRAKPRINRDAPDERTTRRRCVPTYSARPTLRRSQELPPERVVGTFFVDTCNAIKISIDRPNVSASVDERDVFRAQQHSAIETLTTPIYALALAKAYAQPYRQQFGVNASGMTPSRGHTPKHILMISGEPAAAGDRTAS